MIDDANPIDDKQYDEPAAPDAFPGDTDELELTDADAQALRAADAAIDAEDANRVNGGPASADDESDLADPDLAGSLDEDVDEYANEFMAAMANQQKAAADEAEAPKFYEATADLHALDDLDLHGRPSVLERLGPAHFRSKGFSFMGFLQTVYDHVATEVKTKDETVGNTAPAVDAAASEPNTPT